MALPNLCSPSNVAGKNAVLAVPTGVTAIVSNPAASGKSLRVVALYVANVDGNNAYAITAELYDGAAATKLAYNVDVPAKATLSLITKESPLYLEEGDSIRLSTSASGKLEAVASYEEVS